MSNALDRADATGKFRYYIVEVDDGDVKGTNCDLMAKSFAHREDAFVIDTKEASWWQQPLQKVKVNNVEDCEPIR